MPTERTPTLTVPVTCGELSGAKVLADYWSLTKPDVNLLILVTTAAGFCMGPPIHLVGFPVFLLIHTLVGTLLVASGAAALNQYEERRFDAQMRRTNRRPLAAGRIEPSCALCFGLALSLSGTIYLAASVNLLASLLAVLTSMSYLLVYTPLKRKTPLCILVGAFPGAVPPLIGWAAASGTLSLEAWLLYGLIFFWQFPHFMAIAWMYREDYQRAGYIVLPRSEQRDSLVNLQAVLPSLPLIALSITPMVQGRYDFFYRTGALFLSIWFLCYCAQFAFRKTNAAARRLLLASILYLPMVFVLRVLGRT